MDAVPLLSSLVAVITAVPSAMPVTRPVVDTDATVGALDPHVTVRPANTLPAESFGVAMSCTVSPATMLADPGDTGTEATAPGSGGPLGAVSIARQPIDAHAPAARLATGIRSARNPFPPRQCRTCTSRTDNPIYGGLYNPKAP